ncbi:substrate-binding domain-containing protein [Aeoliella sp. SH292]|uniref:substrate-binding domain-containing protein n=1 Tax=Aeoliella sp. SH292 TaxID=3454464 RepID=UPI003F9A2C4A
MSNPIKSLLTLALMASAVGCSSGDPSASSKSGGADGSYTIGFLPKKKGISFFTSCAEGAKEAADELGNVELVYDGPTDGDPVGAAEMVSQWSLEGFDAIAVSADDPQILGTAMEKAQKKGVVTVSWDADTPKPSRSFFVNQATPEQIGNKLVDVLAEDIGKSGKVAIVSSSQTSSNQNTWIDFMKKRLAEYPDITLVGIEYPGEDQDRALETTRTLLKAHPDLKGIWGLSTVSFPAVAEAIRQADKADQVKATGISTPNLMREYIKDGTVGSAVLWNTKDLGYLTVYVAEGVLSGKLKPGASTFDAGRLGERKVEGDAVMLGDILVFTKDNIDDYNF